jgi:hypothetical protein
VRRYPKMAFTPEEWFQNIPKFTRYWMIGMLGTLFLAAMGIIPLGNLLFSWNEVKQFQVRPRVLAGKV